MREGKACEKSRSMGEMGQEGHTERKTKDNWERKFWRMTGRVKSGSMKKETWKGIGKKKNGAKEGIHELKSWSVSAVFRGPTSRTWVKKGPQENDGVPSPGNSRPFLEKEKKKTEGKKTPRGEAFKGKADTGIKGSTISNSTGSKKSPITQKKSWGERSSKGRRDIRQPATFGKERGKTPVVF